MLQSNNSSTYTVHKVVGWGETPRGVGRGYLAVKSDGKEIFGKFDERERGGKREGERKGERERERGRGREGGREREREREGGGWRERFPVTVSKDREL